MSYLEKARDLQAKIGNGQLWEAFEQYYADNVQVQEPVGEIRNGKEAQREAIQQWFGMVKEMHGGGCTSITSDEENGITTAATWTDITFQDGRRTKMEEVAVQKWEGDQIVHERFYYMMPPMGDQAPQQ